MRALRLLVALFLFAGCATVPVDSGTAGGGVTMPPDLILAGGRVFTGDESRRWAEAIAISGETIAAVGSDAEIRPLAGASTRVVELGGKLVIPGINDAHMHDPMALGEMTVIPVPHEATTLDAFLAVLRSAVAAAPAGALLAAELPLPLLDAPIGRDDLDGITTRHRLRVFLVGGHGALLNTPALRDWGIDEGAADPPGGSYGRSDGRLNGWIYEHAYWIPQHREQNRTSDEEFLENIRQFESYLLRHGVTSLQTMPLISPARLEALLAAVPARMRWRVIEFRQAPYGGPPGNNAVKYLLDGTPLERGAALREPWSDRPSSRGALNYTPAEIEAFVRDAARGGRQLLVHASGDAAIDALLEAMKRTPADWPSLRVRIEHGDSLSPDQIPTARELGVAIVQNPSHFMLAEMAHARYGPARMAHTMAARSLLEEGIPFAIGSDGPREPFLNIFFATLHPANPSEALSVEQALVAYTKGAAWAEFEEHRKGTIAPGMLADIAVLSQDIFTAPPPELPKTTSVMTIVGGKVVWEEGGMQ
jgi:predicted amidohydrolase YtcJ